MLAVAAVLALLAALVHTYIFVIETVRFGEPSTLRVFGIRTVDVEVLRPLFWNQGFYNLFLGTGAAVGALLVLAGREATGVPLVVLATGSMLGAAIVLVTSDRTKRRPALVQGLFPLLALLALLVVVLD